MAVFNILCENKATYEYQYTLALYNGIVALTGSFWPLFMD